MFSSHIQKITPKAYKTLGLVRRTFHCPSTTARLHLGLNMFPKFLIVLSSGDLLSVERYHFVIKGPKESNKVHVNDNTSNYELRLISLHLLPLMYSYELQDLLFFIKNLQQPSVNFKLLDYVSFSHTMTRASANFKLALMCTRSTTNVKHHFYF